MSDFNLQITVRNARLLRAIRDAFGSNAELSRASGVHQQAISALLTMRVSPFRRDGELTAPAEAIVSALGVPPEDLWPQHIARLKAKKARVEVEMDAAEFAAIASDADPEKAAMYRLAISRWSRNLRDREVTALAVHHSGGRLEDVAQAVGASRERARQIVAKAERKIRQAAQRDGVRAWEDIA
jgi:lambda repressor-like predicted transcriptional regulator